VIAHDTTQKKPHDKNEKGGQSNSDMNPEIRPRSSELRITR